MNKKFIGLFVIFFIAIMAMGSVNAVNLKNHNFDDYFSMKVPTTDFEKEDGSFQVNGTDSISISYYNDEFYIGYTDVEMFSEDNSAFIFQFFYQIINPDSNKCYESQEGNLKVLEPTKNDGTQVPLVGFCEGNKFLIIAGEDVDLLKEMAHTVKFK